ncbi:intermembrane transport protein PqiB [Roseibacillus persicicus]|uniref:Paraquat-inducible protein B n=1 Tax=Roseibacillus persicicus TaxID=454148 RepID=A0A918TIT7_9BACT|nr:MlaD family protein [Roseibacillus persicicus]MDQ8191222.1 MlaD family protein [Roseibacillus persicicus]GHC47950.1 paraquat-inducible protein B [Roseibacillus persicicus]
MAKSKQTPIQDAAPSDEPRITPVRRISWFWALPLLALVLGLWLVKRHFDDFGELVQVDLPSAEGLSVGKTEVRCRAVKIGDLESISLTEKLEVKLGLRIKPQYLHLLREDSQFWVVKARISGGSVSGLGTVFSGAYIELDPGIGDPGKRRFEGLENPPPTPNSVPGLRLELVTEDAGTVDVGSGVFFKNNLVGKVESRNFDPRREEVRFGIFIEDRYRDLVGTNTIFWGASGLQLRVGPEGVDIELPSLESLLKGRVGFGVIEGETVGEEVTDGFVYRLFGDEKEALASSFESEGEFLLLFEQSVRGLSEGAPVEFRGLKVGRVSEISYTLVNDSTESQTPVLIQLNKRLLEKHFPPELLDEGGGGIEDALKKGLRASLKSANLLTGQRYVDMDYYPEEQFVGMEVLDNYLVLPTVETGLGQLEERVTAVVDKLNGVPIESLVTQLEATTLAAQNTLHIMNEKLESTGPVIAESQATMAEMKASLTALNRILEAESTKAIPDDVRTTLAQINSTLKPLSAEGAFYGDMRRTLDELRSATRSIERLTETISDKPNSLLFGKPTSSDKIPRAKRQ